MRDPGRAWEVWNSEVDYAYATEPQVHAAGITVFWLRGKVLGGSGSLNGMIYVRGHHADYDNWAYDGAAGWSYDEMAAPDLQPLMSRVPLPVAGYEVFAEGRRRQKTPREPDAQPVLLSLAR